MPRTRTSFLGACALIALWFSLQHLTGSQYASLDALRDDQHKSTWRRIDVIQHIWWHLAPGATRARKIVVTQPEGMSDEDFDALLENAEERWPNNADPPAGSEG